MISLVADQDDDSEKQSVSRDDVVGMIPVRVPDGAIRGKRDLIQYTVVVEKERDLAAVEKLDD